MTSAAAVALAVAVTSAALFGAAPSWAARYRHPSECGDGCMMVTAYYDHGGNSDWACGGNTYGGHRGTDFGIFGGFGAVDEGRPVVAAAAGTVVQANDGEFDRCTSGNCSGGGGFGNYVAIQHDDGVVTFYGHMRNGSIAVGVGDVVGCGQQLGMVASSGFSTGPHVHFEPRAGSGLDPFAGPCNGPESMWVDQRDYNSLPAPTCEGPPNNAPFGYVDAATCDGGVVGWAQDPDAPNDAIAVHIYVDGEAGSGARGFPIVAGNNRDDLCAAIGSCNHGYAFAVPNYLKDGAAHTVFAYGIDSAGGNNPLLVGSGVTFSCGVASLDAAGGLRHVTSPDAMTAWALSFDDVTPYASLAGHDALVDWSNAPRLVQANGAPEVYVVETVPLDAGAVDVKRHVVTYDSFLAWHFDPARVELLDPAAVDAIVTAADFPLAPVLVRTAGDPGVFVLDVDPRPPATPPDGAGDGDGTGGDGDGGDGDAAGDDNSDGGDVTIVTTGARPSAHSGCNAGGVSPATAGLIALALVALRRKRSQRAPLR